MTSQMTLKTVLYFLTICMAMGRPPFPLNSGDLSLLSSGINRHSPQVKVPPYMMQLYQTLMSEPKDLHRPENQILEESNTVQSLLAKSCTVEDSRWSVIFYLTRISKRDELRLVELQIILPPFKTPTDIALDIYHTENGQGRVFVGSIMRKMPVSHHSVWKSFNVTEMVGQYLQWGNTVANPKDKYAIEKPRSAVSYLEYSEKPGIALKETSKNQAIMVFFSRDKPFPKPGSAGLIMKMSESSHKIAGFRKQRRNRKNRQIITPTNSYSMPEEQIPLCRKVDMMVDFKELGWDNWVIYPKIYNAYRCEGSCHIPLKNNIKTTNYDYIKSFTNLKEWERVECSSCVPVKMRPLSMLFHEEPNLVLRYHEEMIIEECEAL